MAYRWSWYIVIIMDEGLNLKPVGTIMSTACDHYEYTESKNVSNPHDHIVSV